MVRDDRVLLVRHRREGVDDFWVAPGGGVEGDESLEAAAARQVREETGLAVAPGALLWIEQLAQPGLRHVKFWFDAALLGDATPAPAPAPMPDAAGSFVVEADWFSRARIASGRETVFPPMVADFSWLDRCIADAGSPRVLPLRRMEVW